MDDVDNIGVIQKKLNKAIEKRMSANNSAPKKTGLLAPKSNAVKQKTASKSKMDVESVLADYIVNIRQYKKDILNGSK